MPYEKSTLNFGKAVFRKKRDQKNWLFLTNCHNVSVSNKSARISLNRLGDNIIYSAKTRKLSLVPMPEAVKAS